MLVVFRTPLEEPSVHYFNNILFFGVHPNLTGIACYGTHHVLKRSQRSLTSIIRSSAQWQFSVNNECLSTTVRRSTTLSRFRVVSSKIPRYLKVCTRSITSPLCTNSWHGLAELNTMTFVFFTFIVSPHLAQNCWSVSNCCYNHTFHSNVRARSSAKSNSHTCTSTRAGASHLCYLSAPLGHLNIAQTIGG